MEGKRTAHSVTTARQALSRADAQYRSACRTAHARKHTRLSPFSQPIIAPYHARIIKARALQGAGVCCAHAVSTVPVVTACLLGVVVLGAPIQAQCRHAVS